MGEYRVLKAVPSETSSGANSDGWTPVGGTVEAVNAQQAVRRATYGKTTAERSGTFIAVPARSWQPMTRRVETVEKDAWT